MSYVPPYHPSQPEPDIPGFEIASVPDDDADQPGPGEIVPRTRIQAGEKISFPPLILGVSTFGYGIYADDQNVKSSMPLRVTRLALRSGITAFDTSPWYHPSEIVLGHALAALKVPRKEYMIITKVGKYGPDSRDHIYTPEVVKASVERSLKRIQTDYLDVVYLHDVEYVLPPPSLSGNPLSLLSSTISDTSPPGPEEQQILDGIIALRSLQTQGVIRAVGIAGYPLPILLRLALLTLRETGEPLDLVQTYSHQTLQNSTLSSGYLKAFNEAAKVGQVVSAAPLSMGLLTPSQGPEWHPARRYPDLIKATKEASAFCHERGTTLVDASLRFGYRPLYQDDGRRIPIVVGCTDLDQVHSTLQKWHAVNTGSSSDDQGRDVEDQVKDIFEKRGQAGFSWDCPSEKARSG